MKYAVNELLALADAEEDQWARCRPLEVADEIERLQDDNDQLRMQLTEAREKIEGTNREAFPEAPGMFSPRDTTSDEIESAC